MSRITLAPNASGTGTLTVAAPNTNTDRTITLPDATGTAIINKGSEIFNIDSGGNLGMGTSSPVGAGLTLNLQGSTSSSYSSIVAGSPSNANFVSFYSGQTADPNPSIVYNNSLRIGSATSPNTSGYVERMRIDSSGNVGIGTSSPNAKLEIAATVPDMRLTAGGSLITNFYASASGTALLTVPAAPLFFGTNNTERMRIDASGNLLVGKTSPSYTTAGVSLNAATSQFAVSGTGGTVASFATPVSQQQIGFYRIDTGALMGTINNGATNTVVYATSSDYRLKENVQPMVGALDKIAQLNPVTYNWKSDGSDGQGFIAHELQSVVPDCVSGEKDAVDDEGRPRYQGVDTSFLVATLVSAVQELTARIAALEAK
jgi:hypothetical protein